MPVPQRVALKDCDRLSRYSIFSTRQKCHETGNKRDETRISRRVFRCKRRETTNKHRLFRCKRRLLINKRDVFGSKRGVLINKRRELAAGVVC